MVADVGVVSVAHSCPFHVVVDDARVLAMRHDGQSDGCCSGENLLQCTALVHQHVARRGSHKEFYAGNGVPVELFYGVGIVVCCTEKERIVDVRAAFGTFHLVVQCLNRGGLRVGVGHFEERCNPSDGCRTALALHVSLVFHSRFTEMDVRINHSR